MLCAILSFVFGRVELDEVLFIFNFSISSFISLSLICCARMCVSLPLKFAMKIIWKSLYALARMYVKM